ncbi:phage tail tape measure C-terminal domain-containing protein, partial [Blastomonas sp. CCH2-E1]
KEAEIANESPGQRFLREVSLTGEEINDEVELVATRGLQNLNDQLVDAIFNAESLGDVFSNVAKSIVADLLRIAIQQAVIRPLAENL